MLRQGFNFRLPQLNGGGRVVGGVVLLHLHVEIKLGQGRKLLDRDFIGPRQVSPGHLHRHFHQPLRTAGIEGIVEQIAVLILVGLGGHHRIAVVDAGHRHRVIFAEGDAADETAGPWGDASPGLAPVSRDLVPAGCTVVQRLGRLMPWRSQ
jgi:hypothetical protein